MEPGGRLVLAVVHPINSGHELDREHPEDNLVLVPDYYDRPTYRDEIERRGLRMADPKHPRWSRYPLFLHVRAVLRPGSVLHRQEAVTNLGHSTPQVRGER
jgi:hypothetical protein